MTNHALDAGDTWLWIDFAENAANRHSFHFIVENGARAVRQDQINVGGLQMGVL